MPQSIRSSPSANRVGHGIMPTPEQQREYTRLSGLLQQICMRYSWELPDGTTSVLLTNKVRKVRVEAYRNSEVIGIIPNENTSTAFAADLTRYFADITSPDPDGVIAIVSSPK
ncbi:MAG: hypothetical protein WA542_08755 [Candidatus Acidiferrum sp.]